MREEGEEKKEVTYSPLSCSLPSSFKEGIVGVLELLFYILTNLFNL